MNNTKHRPQHRTLSFQVKDYDLAATLDSGQAFRWKSNAGGWEGVVGNHWVRLVAKPGCIEASSPGPLPVQDLTHYLQTEANLVEIIATFPTDPHLSKAVVECPGLRLLRQDPWECLASFILSSTKQIVQIRQIIELLCLRFGEPLPTLYPSTPAFAFPTPGRIAQLSETDLRACKMGFRAPSLLLAARAVASGAISLDPIQTLPLAQARETLMSFRGVGRKIADCVLLFAYGFQEAFPIDVWIMKALRTLYFPRRKVKPPRLLKFTETYFGPHAGYAQQYLFHYMRTRVKP